MNRLRFRIILNIPSAKWLPRNWRTVVVYGTSENAAIVQNFLGDFVTIEQA